MLQLKALTAVLLLLTVPDSIVSKKADKGQYKPKIDPNDEHGGVKMGLPSDFCDNGKDYIELDWDPTSTDEYTCTEGQRPPAEDLQDLKCTDDVKKPVHHCFPDVLKYDDPLPTSGPHRPLWPRYGEYRYLPVQRWLHNLEHGAVVFLYDPCADVQEVEKFKAVARGCLRKHVLSPYKKIPVGYNFALVAWKCKIMLTAANVSAMVQFVKEHALHGPESVATDGQYSVGLTAAASLVSNLYDQNLCPGFEITNEVTDKIAADSEKRKEEGEEVDKRVMENVKEFLEKKGLLFESKPNDEK